MEENFICKQQADMCSISPSASGCVREREREDGQGDTGNQIKETRKREMGQARAETKRD